MASRTYRWSIERASEKIRDALPGGGIGVTPCLFPENPGEHRFQAMDGTGAIVAQAETLDLLMEKIAPGDRRAA